MIREAASVRLADVVHAMLQIVAIEEWFKGKMPLLPPLEHLPSAAFSGRRRPSLTPMLIDAAAAGTPLSFKGGNPAMLDKAIQGRGPSR
jgi:site-specific DNA-methyltransferase (adenine-specific)